MLTYRIAALCVNALNCRRQGRATVRREILPRLEVMLLVASGLIASRVQGRRG